MLPLRAYARLAWPPRLPRPTQLARSSLPRPSPSRPAAHYLALGPAPSIRCLHSSPSTLKEKRWLNNTPPEDDGEDGHSSKQDDQTEKPLPEAESSKSAEERAKSQSSKPDIKASSSDSVSSPSAPAPGSPGGQSPPGAGGPKEITKPVIPEIYPQVLAIPITHRPLFPGFYKAITVRSPPVIKAIRELQAHGQPYVGAFLLKDSSVDSDVVTDINQVQPVGVFCQITSCFTSQEGEGKPEALTAVLFPHRRIRINELVTSSSVKGVGAVGIGAPVEEGSAEGEGEVKSFESEVPGVEEVREELGTVSIDSEQQLPDVQRENQDLEKKEVTQIDFLHSLLPQVSLTNVSNLSVEPYEKDSQVIRAIMSELISVFKEIAQLQPMFREQGKRFDPFQAFWLIC